MTALAVLLIAFGLLKLLPEAPVQAEDPVGRYGVTLVSLASGGILPAGWGRIVVGLVQVVLGVLLLIPPWRTLAGWSCVLVAGALAVGIGWYWPLLATERGINQAGIALIVLSVVLLVGGALALQIAAARAAQAKDEKPRPEGKEGKRK
ncbi:MAG: hypothetical protein N3B15_07675 [Planctomycetota bacterium]|nr:hypothetical protein [Planctomycetota bacterium]MCX8040431.1 hypothetical protein [Planctomycetota bacterium]